MLIFASVGNLLFVSIPEYESLNEAMMTLFSAAMGDFDFGVLHDNDKGVIVGEIYMITFVIFNLILILNLLIAILASTYSRLETKQLVLYINEILKMRPAYQYNSNASSLVSSFAPLNAIPLVFSPFFFCKRST